MICDQETRSGGGFLKYNIHAVGCAVPGSFEVMFSDQMGNHSLCPEIVEKDLPQSKRILHLLFRVAVSQPQSL